MKIIAIGENTPTAIQDDFTPYLDAEARRVWELQQAGVIREIYFRADRPDAVIVLECKDLKTAHAALNTLPLVREGLIAFSLIPLRPYPGLGRLFREPPAARR
jgi:hypothetical protein